MDLQLMRLRKEAGYKSRKVIADVLGISERKYKSWETEEVRLTLDDACDIADLLDCTLDELAGCWRDAERRVHGHVHVS